MIKILLVLMIAGGCLFLARAGSPENRKPAVAGSWYEGTAEGLKKQVTLLLDAARRRRTLPLPAAGRPVAVVVPHAGYQYSGPAAAAAFSCLTGHQYERVILLGPSHRARFTGIALDGAEAFETPLGSLAVDRETRQTLLQSPLFAERSAAHRQEHDLECQLPFLQHLFPEIKIIPLLTGGLTGPEMDGVAEALLPLLDARTLLVISTDFTHYGPGYDFVPFRQEVPGNLRQWARKAAESVARLDFSAFNAHLEATDDTICGRYALGTGVKLLAKLARRAKIEGRVLEYAFSGEMTGDWTNSVSYVSILFTGQPAPAAKSQPPEKKEFSLTSGEKQCLLRLARQRLECHFGLAAEPVPGSAGFPLTDTLNTPCGAFVTLTKSGRLRGCIGYVVPVVPLHQAVTEMVMNAALRDRRFPAVTAAELASLRIEISVLSPLSECRDHREIRVGKHGLYIRKGASSGLLLPQVAVEYGWDRETFLRQVCQKAGLPENAYLEPDAILSTFSAVIFHEEK